MNNPLPKIMKVKLFVYAAAVIAFVILALQGCSLDKAIKVDVPNDVLVATGAKDVSLANAEQVWQDWTYHIESNSQRFLDGVDRANERYAVIQSLISLGIQIGGEGANTLPYGGLIFGALTGLVGLAVPQPKVFKDLTKKKE
jgi:hypothetical protein